MKECSTLLAQLCLLTLCWQTSAADLAHSISQPSLDACDPAANPFCTSGDRQDDSSTDETVFLQSHLVTVAKHQPENATALELPPSHLHRSKPKPRRKVVAELQSLGVIETPKANHVRQLVDAMTRTVGRDPLVLASGLYEQDPDKRVLVSAINEGFEDASTFISMFFFAVYVLWLAKDLNTMFRLHMVKKSEDDTSLPIQLSQMEDQQKQWSIIGIWGLCSYRLYTGFLSATWLPYVLAMEGAILWPDDQSLFMGVAKLIYGLTVLANPMCGLLGDKLAELSYGAARRFYILLGIVLSALGIFTCLYAAPAHEYYLYMFGITLWRVGEALNDVTTEAIIPEMVPKEQFEVASGIKTSSFLAGGLLGYYLVYVYADISYEWVYYAYLLSMFFTAIPSLILLDNDAPKDKSASETSSSLWKEVLACYTNPMYLPGGFSEISFAIFIVACGSSPFFFCLLMIRDLVGVHSSIMLQHAFAFCSILFFCSAALAACYDVIMSGGRRGPNSRQRAEGSRMQMQEIVDANKGKMKALTVVAILDGIIVIMFSLVYLLKDDLRSHAFYTLVVIFGILYGFGFARFQDATWSLMPDDADTANAMGFNVMCRNFGVGVGNFCAGILLDFFKLPKSSLGSETFLSGSKHISVEQVYSFSGYVVMCSGCSVCNFIGGFMACYIKNKYLSVVPASAG